MNNKLILILLIFILCGCNSRILNSNSNSLIDLGYSNEEIEKIETLSKEHQELFKDKYDEILIILINDSEFNEDNLDDYLRYNIDIKTRLYLVNNNIINETNSSIISDLLNDKFYIKENTNLYLKYKDEFSDTRSLIEYVNAKAYKIPYEEYVESDLTKDTLMIASKLYSLGNYVPEDLVEVEEGYRTQDNNYLRKEAYDAYLEMANDARNEGYYFYISTSYRSYDYQEYFYNKYLSEYKDQAYVDTFSARPGFSDHQTGLTCDIRQKEGNFETVKGTPEMQWLKDNSYKYGFILRYPEGKDNITGYEHEWWHFRYVGKDAAKIIYDNNITFDEYYAYYVEMK